MNLISSHPFWSVNNGLPVDYPSLQRDVSCEAVVIGGGITGALVAVHLAEAGLKTLLIAKRHIGTGSTSASTALLQYGNPGPARGISIAPENGNGTGVLRRGRDRETLFLRAPCRTLFKRRRSGASASVDARPVGSWATGGAGGFRPHGDDANDANPPGRSHHHEDWFSHHRPPDRDRGRARVQ